MSQTDPMDNMDLPPDSPEPPELPGLPEQAPLSGGQTPEDLLPKLKEEPEVQMPEIPGQVPWGVTGAFSEDKPASFAPSQHELGQELKQKPGQELGQEPAGASNSSQKQQAQSPQPPSTPVPPPETPNVSPSQMGQQEAADTAFISPSGWQPQAPEYIEAPENIHIDPMAELSESIDEKVFKVGDEKLSLTGTSEIPAPEMQPPEMPTPDIPPEMPTSEIPETSSDYADSNTSMNAIEIEPSPASTTEPQLAGPIPINADLPPIVIADDKTLPIDHENNAFDSIELDEPVVADEGQNDGQVRLPDVSQAIELVEETEHLDAKAANLKQKGWVDLSSEGLAGAVDAPVSETGDLEVQPIPEVFKPESFIDIEARQKEAPEDLKCRGCGYQLHGLKLIDQCPECGLPVVESMHGTELVLANKDWLQRLVRGTILILCFILIRVSLPFIHTFFMIPNHTDLSWLGWTVTLLFALAGGCAFLWGLFHLSEPEPRIDAKEIWRAQLHLKMPHGAMKLAEFDGSELDAAHQMRQRFTLLSGSMIVLALNLSLIFEMPPMDKMIGGMPKMLSNLLMAIPELLGLFAVIECGLIYVKLSRRIPCLFYGGQVLLLCVVLCIGMLLWRASQMDLINDQLGGWGQLIMFGGGIWMMGALFLLLTDMERTLDAAQLLDNKYGHQNSTYMH